MPALIPVFFVVVASIISVGSIVVNTLESEPTPSPSSQESPSPSPLPKTSPVPASSASTANVGNATVLTYDLASTTVVTDSANDNDCANDCPTKPLAQHISDNGGRAGMNGTYFCPMDYDSCAGKLFLVIARNSSYMDLANIFKSLDATEALNLDGGGSVALYDGGYKVGPGRSLPNAVIIK